MDQKTYSLRKQSYIQYQIISKTNLLYNKTSHSQSNSLCDSKLNRSNIISLEINKSKWPIENNARDFGRDIKLDKKQITVTHKAEKDTHIIKRIEVNLNVDIKKSSLLSIFTSDSYPCIIGKNNVANNVTPLISYNSSPSLNRNNLKNIIQAMQDVVNTDTKSIRDAISSSKLEKISTSLSIDT